MEGFCYQNNGPRFKWKKVWLEIELWIYICPFCSLVKYLERTSQMFAQQLGLWVQKMTQCHKNH